MLLVGVPLMGGVATVAMVSGGSTPVSSGLGLASRTNGGTTYTRVRLALVALICVLGVQTWVLARVWSDSETLWRRTISVNPVDHAAMGSLGSLLHSRGLYQSAIDWHSKAIDTHPEYSPYHANLGNALQVQGCMWSRNQQRDWVD